MRFIFILSGLEVLALGTHYLRQEPEDLESRFDRMTKGSAAHLLSADIAGIEREPVAKVGPLLIQESGHPDENRASVAVWLAYRLGLAESIPADHRLRVLLGVERKTHQEPGNRERHFFGHPEERAIFFSNAFYRASKETRKALFTDLAAGKRTAPENRLISVALGRTADSELILEMHAYLLRNPSSALAWPVLVAFAARTDLPLTDDQETWPIYQRHLPGILDPASREAKWVAAVALLRDLPTQHGLLDNFDAGCGVLPPADIPIETVNPRDTIRGKEGLEWPMTDERVAHWRERINSWISFDVSYGVALLIRWHQSGRLTLPYFPFEIGEALHRDLRRSPLARSRGKAQAAQILDPARYPMAAKWICGVVGTGPRTEAGQLLTSRTGQGPVQATLLGVQPGSSENFPIRLGFRIQPGGPGLSDENAAFRINVQGAVQQLEDSAFRFEGSVHQARERNSSGGSSQACARLGEALVLDADHSAGSSSRGHHSSEDRQRSFTILWFGSGAEWNSQMGWKTGIAGFLSRWSSAPAKAFGKYDPWADPAFSVWDLGRMLQVTAWIPVPEARESLRKLWDRREELKGAQEARQEGASLADRVGISLLLTGDDSPLADTSLVASMPPDEALRVFMFSPNPAVWNGLDERAVMGVTEPIAADVRVHLAARGDEHSRVAVRARTLQAGHVWDSLADGWITLLIAFALAAAAWFPRASRNKPALAASLVITGLVFQFLTVEVDGRVWLLFLGDLLFLAGAAVLGKRALLALTGLLAMTGLIQILLPEADWAATAGRALLAVYLGWLSVSRLSTPSWGGRCFIDSFAHVALWLLMIVPLAAGVAAEFLPSRPGATIRLDSAWAPVIVVVMFLPPFAIAYAWRSQALANARAIPADPVAS